MSLFGKLNIFKSTRICEKIKDLYGIEYKSDGDIKWVFLLTYIRLGEDFIEEFLEIIEENDYMSVLCIYQSLSEDFIKRHKDQVDWNAISRYQVLSEEFIEEFRSKLDWDYISLCQPYVNPKHPFLINLYYSNNDFSKLYQETKDQGWFIGYLEPGVEDRFIISLEGYDQFDNPVKKVRVYWKDLDLIDRAKKYEPIREVKVCCVKK